MSDLDLDAIRKRVNAAPEGPWTLELVGDHHDRGYMIAAIIRDLYGDNALDFGEDQALGEFVAHSREDVPALLAEVKRLRAQANAPRPRPRHVVCLCGSTRFRDEMADVNRQLTLSGFIVVAPGVFQHQGDEITDAQKIDLAALHVAKIDLADHVVVVCPGGYIGDSTRYEIAYAEKTGKPVTFWGGHPTQDRCFFCVTDVEMEAAVAGRPHPTIHMQIPGGSCPNT